MAALAKAYPHVQESLLPFFCLDLSYVHTLLTDGFDIPDGTKVTLVKKVGGVGAGALLIAFKGRWLLQRRGLGIAPACVLPLEGRSPPAWPTCLTPACPLLLCHTCRCSTRRSR